MTLQEFADSTKNRSLPPGPKVLLELADGSFAVKVQSDGEVGYLHVAANGISTGNLLTLEDIARLRAH